MRPGIEPRGPREVGPSGNETLDTPAFDSESAIGLSVGILVHNGRIFEEPEYYERERPEQIAEELQDLTKAERVQVSHIDPTVGAGTNGLAFLFQFLDTSAAVITWGVAIQAIYPRICAAVAHLRSLFQNGESPVTISMTAEALQVLAMADVCSRHDVAPSDILRLRCISHETELLESRPELKQLYAAHTITVEAVGSDDYHHVWVYTVSPRGKVLAESEVQVPMPNATDWDWPATTPGRMLEGL